MNLLEELQKAADRGVEVTIITGGGDPALELKLKGWKFWNTRDTGCGEYRAAGMELIVRDLDGDDSYWELRDLRKKRRENVIAKGAHDKQRWPNHYHFDACLMAAEAALFEEVDRRLAVLRRNRRRRERARGRR